MTCTQAQRGQPLALGISLPEEVMDVGNHLPRVPWAWFTKVIMASKLYKPITVAARLSYL